jgi:fibronectin type 3 domain-containing protein
VDKHYSTTAAAIGADRDGRSRTGHIKLDGSEWSDGLHVKRATVSGGPYTTIAGGVVATSYTDTGLTNGTTYYYVVSTVSANGESLNSAQVSAKPVAPPLFDV